MGAINTDPTMDLMKFLESDHKQLMRTHDVAKLMGISLETIYDWKYRAKQKNVPQVMFLKINQMLFVRTDLLKSWLLSKSSGI
jgi:hypothetical protein